MLDTKTSILLKSGAMDAQTFLEKFGDDEAEAIAVAASTNLAYFKQLARRQRHPSYKLAERLVSASGNRLDLLLLLKRETTTAA